MSPEPVDREPAADVNSAHGAWAWVPSLYFAEGIPYVVVMAVSVVMYKRLGVSNTEIALYTSLLYLPWIIKPLWSPLVDVVRTKRWWIVTMQLLIGAGLAGVALSLPTSEFFRYTLACFWLLALSSATHDIAADGFYMLGLSEHDQAWFVGIRSTFYRLAMIAGSGLLVMLAGVLESATGLPDTQVVIVGADTPAWDMEFMPAEFDRSAHSENQRVLTMASNLAISLEPLTPDAAAALIDSVRGWNVHQGFYEDEQAIAQTEKEKSQWLMGLESWIRKRFGQAQELEEVESTAGSIALVQMAVARPVESGEIVVQFEPDSGSSNFQVVEGHRFTVTPQNWQQPFVAAVQLDPRVKESESAIFHTRSGNFVLAWTSTFYLMAAMFVGLFLYHAYVLPRPEADKQAEDSSVGHMTGEFAASFVTFFRKAHIGRILAFLLLYRFSESQLVKLAAPFLLEAREQGGLALTTAEVGFVYGTVGVALLTLGGILGGWLAARHGLKAWLWAMVVAINLPNLAYLVLSYLQPEGLWPVIAAVSVEQFGYGFGFTAYMVFMLYVSQGEHETAHYAICTGFMALGMMLPGMFSGWLQELIGYQHFFIWVLLATVPAFIATLLVPLDPEFGKKATEASAESIEAQ